MNEGVHLEDCSIPIFPARPPAVEQALGHLWLGSDKASCSCMVMLCRRRAGRLFVVPMETPIIHTSMIVRGSIYMQQNF